MVFLKCIKLVLIQYYSFDRKKGWGSSKLCRGLIMYVAEVQYKLASINISKLVHMKVARC